MGSFERTNDRFLHLRTKGFSSDNIGTRHRNWKQLLSELQIPVSKLEREGEKGFLEIPPGRGFGENLKPIE